MVVVLDMVVADKDRADGAAVAALGDRGCAAGVGTEQAARVPGVGGGFWAGGFI